MPEPIIVKQEPAQVIVKGNDVDYAGMLNNYACKLPPDNTIVRIEDLEKLGKTL